MLFNVGIPCLASTIVFFSLCIMAFYLHDAIDKEDKLPIVINTILADIVLIVCAVILVHIFSIIALIVFILAAFWLVSQY